MDKILINPKEEIVNLLFQLQKLPTNTKMNKISKMSLSSALFDSQVFFKEFYELYPVIQFQPNSFNPYKKIDPFDLPIKLVPSSEYFLGALIIRTPTIFHKQPSFLRIELNELTTEVTTCTYVHEITHSQLESYPISYKNIKNREVLSKFNALFSAYILDPTNEKILRLYDSYNIYEMANSALELRNYFLQKEMFDYNYLKEASIYLVSDIKAFALFQTFYEASDEVKQDIIDNIQKVFAKELSVEELLSYYEINLHNQSLKKLTKYFKRSN